jgi:hypothetical protein
MSTTTENTKVAAKGRGGIVNVRNGNFTSENGQGWAVDAKLPGSNRESARKGLIFRFFADKDAATEFAAKINAGEHPKHGKDASGAIVVKAYNADVAPFLQEA